MARKTVSEQDRALAFIKAATREQLDSFIQTATLVRDVRYPAAAPVKAVKKAKANGVYPERTPGVAAILGEPQ